MKRGFTLTMLAGTMINAGACYAQSVISAQSGLLNHLEGKAFIQGRPVTRTPGRFTALKTGEVFQTTAGRAEIVLTPGVFLRVGEQSGIRMVSTALTDTRISVIKGAVLVECAELLKANSVTLMAGQKQILIRKKALVRVDAEPARLRVYAGEATVYASGHAVRVGSGRELMLEGVQVIATKFNKNDDPGELYAWGLRRAGILAYANRTATLSQTQIGRGTSRWMYLSDYGMVTFIPSHGSYHSPFGCRFYSPRTVPNPYARPDYGYNSSNSSSAWSNSSSTPSYNSDYGYTTGDRSSSSASYSSSSNAASSTSSAPSRSDSGGSRGGSSSGGHR